MGKKWRQLKYEDRLKIYAWLQDKTSVATIAKRLGVCRQTIYREIKRGEFVKRNTDYTESTVYDPYVAEEHYQKKLKERGRDLKIGSDLKLLHYIEKKIVDEKRSPAAALHEIKKEGKEFTVTLSTNTIYSYIKKGIFLNITMEDLPEKKKQHKKKKVKVQKRVQAGDSISQRPEHIDFREEFGHWEMDTVVGPQGKSKKVMLVLTERKTRKEIVYLMPDRKAQTVVKTLNMINFHTANLRPTKSLGVREPRVWLSETKRKTPECSGVSFFRAGNSNSLTNAFHICVYVHLCVVPRYIASQHPWKQSQSLLQNTKETTAGHFRRSVFLLSGRIPGVHELLWKAASLSCGRYR